MNELLYIVTNFDLKTKTGTPTRTRTTIDSLGEITEIKVLSTSSYNSNTIDFTKKLDGLGQSKLRKLPGIYAVTQLFREPIVMIILFTKLVKERPKKIYSIALVAGCVVAFYRLLFGCEHILEIHSLGKFQKNFLIRICEWIAVKSADKIVIPSKKMGIYLEKKYGFMKSKIHLIYGPVKSTAKKNGKKYNDFVFGYGGNDAYYQGVDTLLKAAKLCLKKDSELKFVFAGFDKEKYSKISEKNIEFLGRVEDKEFLDALESSDVLLCGYMGDFAEYTYPHKISTYLELGKPILSTSTGDLKEIIEDNNCGKTFPQNDYKKLADLMLEFSQKNKKELNEMGFNSRKFFEQNLSISAFKQKLKGLLKG
ncbi:MAG: glycosyltransferase [archaeon]|nr:glycosyltransferase [archaeon]